MLCGLLDVDLDSLRWVWSPWVSLESTGVLAGDAWAESGSPEVGMSLLKGI